MIRAAAALALFLSLAGCQVKDSCRFADVDCGLFSYLIFARAPNARYAIISNLGSTTANVYSISKADGSLTATQTVALAATPVRQAAVDSLGTYAYIADNSNINSYSISQAGTLTQNQTSIAVANLVTPVLDAPGFAYSSQSAGTLQTFTIDSLGRLSSASNVGTLANAQVPIMHPSKTTLYLANSAGTAVNVHTLTNGIPGAAQVYTAPNTNAQNLEIDPLGRNVYMTFGGGGTVTVAAVASNGTLSTRQSIGSVSNPNAIELDPAGTFAYVNNLAGSTITVFRVNSDGTLTLLQSVPSTSAPGRVVFHPVLPVLYVPDQTGGTMTVYSRSNGVLAQTQSVATGTSNATNPPVVVIDPRGRTLYLSNSISSNVSVFSIGTSGTLTSLQTISTGLTTPAPVTLVNYLDF